jgi:hypothetical protein
MLQEETPESYAVLCKNNVQRIRQIQQEIVEYLGIREIATEEVVV